MAEVKIRPGSLEIEVVNDEGETVAKLSYPNMTLRKVMFEPKPPKPGEPPEYGKTRPIWEAATAGR